ncbi:MAG: aminopeptidase N [Actinomycetota bacterium]
MPRTLRRDEARRRSALISRCSYDVALDLALSEDRFGSTTSITFDCAEPGTDTFIDFVCDQVKSITLNGKSIPVGNADGDRIALPALEAHNTLVIVGNPMFEHTGVGLHRFVDPVDANVYLHTQFEAFNARRVYACFDQPDIKGSFSFEVRAHKDWSVASNETVVDRIEDGEATTWKFGRTKTMPTYITAVVAGPYTIVKDKHGDIDLSLWIRKSLAQYLEADEMFEVTKQGFDFYHELFDYPYPFGKYDQLFVPEFNAGAMENAGCVTFSESYVFRSKVTESRRERRAATILHEMAHMWFGDLVTMRWWDDLWLNESFAEYIALVAQVRATRFTNGFVTFSDAEKTWAYRQDQMPTTHPIAADCPDVESAEVNFDGISYAKGASVLKQLVAWVGEQAFNEGLRSYFRRYEFANADLVGFLDELEQSSGRDLQAWAKDWLQTPGVNTLRALASIKDGTYAEFSIEQTAPPMYPAHRSHRIGIGLYDLTEKGFVKRDRVELDVAGDRTQATDIAGKKLADLVLINDDDLTFAKIRLDDRSVKTLRGSLHQLNDPLARSLCWAMFWDMVRDAELPARAWSAIVLANAHAETDVGVLRSLLDKVRSAALAFGDPSNRGSALALLADHALDSLRKQEPGSDFQLVWAQAFISAVRSEEHAGIARGLLDGSNPFVGLKIDTDLRWHIVRSLAVTGSIDKAMIDAELARDSTDQGARHAAASCAALPDPVRKEAAWSQIIDEATPFATMRSLLGGFQQHEQSELMRPFRDRYFEQIATMYETRDMPVAMEFAEDMFPHVLVSTETIERAQGYLAAANIPAPIKRFVIEGVDSVQRALRAREIDSSAGSA